MTGNLISHQVNRYQNEENLSILIQSEKNSQWRLTNTLSRGYSYFCYEILVGSSEILCLHLNSNIQSKVIILSVKKKKSLTAFTLSYEVSNIKLYHLHLKYIFVIFFFKNKTVSLLLMEIKKTQQNIGDEKHYELLLVL